MFLSAPAKDAYARLLITLAEAMRDDRDDVQSAKTPPLSADESQALRELASELRHQLAEDMGAATRPTYRWTRLSRTNAPPPPVSGWPSKDTRQVPAAMTATPEHCDDASGAYLVDLCRMINIAYPLCRRSRSPTIVALLTQGANRRSLGGADRVGRRRRAGGRREPGHAVASRWAPRTRVSVAYHTADGPGVTVVPTGAIGCPHATVRTDIPDHRPSAGRPVATSNA